MAAPSTPQTFQSHREAIDIAPTRAISEARSKAMLSDVAQAIGDLKVVDGTDWVCVGLQRRVLVKTSGAHRNITLLHPSIVPVSMELMKADDPGFKAIFTTPSGVIHFANVTSTQHQLVDAGDSAILWSDGTDFWIFK